MVTIQLDPNVKVLLGPIDNVYPQDMAGVITFESDNTTVNYTNTQTGANIETVDTTVRCPKHLIV